MKLTNWEKMFLKYFLKNYKAKWMQVYNNKHPFFATTVDFFTIYKRHLKNQPITGQLTSTGMFSELIEGEWYFIPDLLDDYKEE